MMRLVRAGAAALLAATLCAPGYAGLVPFLPSAAASAPVVIDADRQKQVTPEALSARLQALQQQLDTLEDPPGASSTDSRKRFLLQWQINTLREHQALLRVAEVEKLAADSIKPTSAAASVATDGNKSWRLDHLRADLQGRADEVKKRESDIQVLSQLIDASQTRVDQEAKSQRLIENNLGRRIKPENRAGLLRDRELSLLTQQSWSALLDLHYAKLSAQQQRLQQARQALQENEQLLQRQADNGQISPDELAQILGVNDRHRERVEQEMGVQSHAVDAMRAQLIKLSEQDQADDHALTALHAERSKLEHEAQHGQRLEQVLRDATRLSEAMAQRQRERKLILLQVRTNEIAVDMLGVMLNALALERTFWEHKANGSDATNLSGNNFNRALDPFDNYEKLVRTNLDLVQSQLARALLQADPGSSSLTPASDQPEAQNPAANEFRKRQQYYTETLSALTQIRRMLERRMSDFDVNVHEMSGSARLDYWRTELLSDVAAVWNFELFNVNDQLEIDGQTLTVRNGVTVGKVIAAVLLVTLGGWVAARLMKVVERLAISRGGMQPVTARIARRWLFVVVMMGLAAWSLSMVRIPLTAFAFMGGAVAIGIGFGTQNLLKNLISGLMIMGERPMRPGDWIEVGALQGEVTDINLRATIIRDVNGIETLIPNSSFVEQNVTNWTLSNRMVRRSIQIGVAYGSPTRTVAELLESAVQRHGVICQTPPPEVLFENFGDSALMFGVYFWLEMRPGVSARQVLSDLRYMIDKSFAENGIVIAYPQRDIHLDTTKPLVVQLSPAQPGPPPSTNVATPTDA